MSEARKKLTARRVLAHVAVAVAGAYALYLLLIHLVIATPLLTKFTNTDSEMLFVDYGSAWSLWPGRVHVRALRIRFKDSVSEGYLAFDKLVGTFDLFSLAKRQLRVRDIDATGTVIRVRPRMAPEQATEQALEGVAEIPGFTGPPLIPTEPHRVLTEENYKFFEIDLEDARVHSLRELWIGPYRFAGDARASGGFYLRPNRKFMLRPSTMTVQSGELTLGKRFFGQDVRGTVEMKIKMHDPRAVDAAEFFRHVDAHLALESGVEDIGFLQRWLGKAKVHISGGKGHAKSDVRLAAGVLQDGSWLELDAKRALVHSDVRGSAWFDALGKLAIERGEWRGTVTFSDVRAERRHAENYPFRSERIDVLATSRSLDLANRPGDDLRVALDMPRGVLTDVRALRGLFGKKTKLEKGAAHVKLHLEYSPRERLFKGEASVDTPNLALNIDNVDVTAHALFGVRLSRLDIDAMSGTIPHAYIEVRDAVVRAPKGGQPPPPWWGRADIKDLAIDGDREPVALGSFAFAARDARPALYVLDAKKQSIPDWAKGILAMRGLSLVGRLELGPGIGLENVSGEGGPFNIGGHVHAEKKRTDGEVLLGWGPFSLKVNLGPGGGVTPGIGGGPKSAP